MHSCRELSATAAKIDPTWNETKGNGAEVRGAPPVVSPLRMLETFATADAWIALLTLTTLEIILGIDNIVFIAILTARLPKDQQRLAYRLGLGGAMITRIALLLAISWVMNLTNVLFTIFGEEISGRDLILLVGGLFLIAKSVHEIYEKVEVHEEEAVEGWSNTLGGVIAQIMVLDIVFSLDSVITAVGMVDEVEVMVVALVIAVLIMLAFARPVGDFVNRHPSMKILALSFLMLIGVVLVADGLDQHIPKGYIYFAMSFGLLMELLNMRLRKKSKRKVAALQEPVVPEDLAD